MSKENLIKEILTRFPNRDDRLAFVKEVMLFGEKQAMYMIETGNLPDVRGEFHQRKCENCLTWFDAREIAIASGVLVGKRYSLDKMRFHGKDHCFDCLPQYIAKTYFTCNDCGEFLHKNGFVDGYCKKCHFAFLGNHRSENRRLYLALRRADGDLGLRGWIDTLQRFNWECAYCGGEFEAIEHFVPVSQGGLTTDSNCVPACKSCNSKKHGKHPLVDELPDFDQTRIQAIIEYLGLEHAG